MSFKKIIGITCFAFFGGLTFAQTFPLNIADQVELRDFVIVDDQIYAAGSIIQYPTYIPIVVCSDMRGDTCWTKTYPKMCRMGKFTAIHHFRDSLYIIGRGSSNESYYSDEYSFLIRVSKEGKHIAGGYFDHTSLYQLTSDETNIWITGEYREAAQKRLFLLKGNEQFNEVNNKYFASAKNLKSTFSGNDIAIRNGVTWVCSECETKTGEALTVSRFSENLDSLGTTFVFTQHRGSCQKIFIDSKNRVWAAGHAKIGEDSLGLGVVCLNETGEILFSTCLNLASNMGEAYDIEESTNGDILILSKKNGVVLMYQFEDFSLVKTHELKEMGDSRPVKMIPYKDNQFVILSLILDGQFYGKSAFTFWSLPG